jgi:cytochrome c-type biogenesis protein CcmH/NrfF
MKYIVLILTMILVQPIFAQGSGSDAPFANQQLSNPALEAKARTLMGELRCIQCQGQSIADSDAPIAGAMRSEVRQRIAAGETPDAIRNWLISRYGEWVSYQPPKHGAGLFLWILPFLLLIIALWSVRGLFSREKT